MHFNILTNYYLSVSSIILQKMLFLLSYLNLPLFYLFKISGSKMDLKSFLRYFYTKEKLAFSLILSGFASYFPQHCLYFLPLPHARPLTIFYLYIVQIVLCVFPLFYGHLVHYIISIIYIINITNFICYVDKMWTRIIFSQHFCFLGMILTKRINKVKF